ncbi:hypothetical protein I8748_31080 [Nostoc sp. CENA67]|uniref:Uncharacterized protein n=1 Tax=Amazonocrinis nigriterrae CENA67 TaxID=2794033 RepID=A0A8J7LC97_9NOST|nr:hypothetical protein [Amazonocrinis nigriterrae]MBH8566545.1 hypothetical protein [Amazonocrinis nigriterrae CENA67]
MNKAQRYTELASKEDAKKNFASFATEYQNKNPASWLGWTSENDILNVL